MEKFLASLEIKVFTSLEKLMEPIPIIAGGVGLFVGNCVLISMYIKIILHMTGQSGDAFLPMIRDHLLKVFILIGIATAPTYYNSLVVDTVIKTTNELALAVSGTEHIFSDVGKLLDNTMEALTASTTAPEKLPNEDEPSVMGLFKFIGRSIWNAVETTFGGIVTFLSCFLKFCIIAIGAVSLAIVAFSIVALNKIFAYISLAVGPIFIAFAAFEKTRGWFQSWLNTMLGYAFSYVTVMIVWAFMTTILSDTFYTPNGKEPSWIVVFQSFICCWIFTFVISRLGDLTSAWFSAGNIADGTAGVMSLAGRSHAKTLGKLGVSSARGSLSTGRRMKAYLSSRSKITKN